MCICINIVASIVHIHSYAVSACALVTNINSLC